MDKNSKAYKQGGCEKMSYASGSASIVNGDVRPYSRSLERLQAFQSGFDYIYEEGVSAGIEKGIEKKKTRRIVVRKRELGKKLKTDNFDINYSSFSSS